MQALEKINHSIGQELSSAVGKGKKRKIKKNIKYEDWQMDQESGKRQIVLHKNDEENVKQ